jgi:beta-lactamase superfamily II metal-dependent hydrolase
VSHHAFLVSHEDHNHMGAGENILWQDRRPRCKAAATSGGNKTLSETFRQTLELTVGVSARRWKTSDRTWWKGRPLPKWKKRLLKA